MKAGADQGRRRGWPAGNRRPAPLPAGRESRRKDPIRLQGGSAAGCAAVSRALIAGRAASVRPTKARSRGDARPVVMRANEPLQIVDVFQRLAQIVAQPRVGDQFGDRFGALVDGRQIGQRIGQPVG